jgi:hypothetical protein
MHARDIPIFIIRLMMLVAAVSAVATRPASARELPDARYVVACDDPHADWCEFETGCPFCGDDDAVKPTAGGIQFETRRKHHLSPTLASLVEQCRSCTLPFSTAPPVI